ncbi:hypothetical protein P8452_42230 [Trifolium repens]|nr:hypothetical protein P8452_42230 [Trifolium repens]
MTKPMSAKPAAPQAPPSPTSSSFDSSNVRQMRMPTPKRMPTAGDHANQASSASTEPIETDKSENAGSA